MNINLNIESIVIEGVDIPQQQQGLMHQQITTRLTHLLTVHQQAGGEWNAREIHIIQGNQLMLPAQPSVDVVAEAVAQVIFQELTA